MNRGAKHLLTVLTCFLSRKQMQVHTREAIKRKALIPICNCFSISTGLLTGPKSGSTLSPVSNLRSVYFLSPFFHSTSRRESRTRCCPPRIENRKIGLFYSAAYRKQMIAPPQLSQEPIRIREPRCF